MYNSVLYAGFCLLLVHKCSQNDFKGKKTLTKWYESISHCSILIKLNFSKITPWPLNSNASYKEYFKKKILN